MDMILSLASAAAMGRPLSSLIPIAVTAGLVVVLLSITLLRFQNEEF